MVLTRRNLGRTTRLWSWVALLGAPFFLVMGLLLVAGTGPGSAPPLELWRTAGAGEALELPASGRDAVVWGAPADVDPARVTCTTARGDGSGAATLGAAEGASTAQDVGGTGTWARLGATTRGVPAATVTCAGGGLERVGVSAPTSARGGPGLGWALVGFAPVLAGLGLLARRAGRSPALAA